MKGYAAFPQVPALLELHHQIVWCHNQDTRCGVSYPSTEMQSVYSPSRLGFGNKRSRIIVIIQCWRYAKLEGMLKDLNNCNRLPLGLTFKKTLCHILLESEREYKYSPFHSSHFHFNRHLHAKENVN